MRTLPIDFPIGDLVLVSAWIFTFISNNDKNILSRKIDKSSVMIIMVQSDGNFVFWNMNITQMWFGSTFNFI